MTPTIKALQFRKSIPRYAFSKLLGSRSRKLSTFASPLALRDVPRPRLPTPHWVRVAPRLAGVCGSDVATICASGSTYLGSLTSMPFVLGHEIVGVVTECGREVTRVSAGDRVVLHPALGCKARRIDPQCNHCQLGHDALCRNVARGDISAGIQTGYCRDTAGGFGENFVAHESQLYRVPETLEDRHAVLIEPFACALHGVLQAFIGNRDTVLIIGCGSIGLLVIAALRALGCAARVAAVARYDHQRQLASALGANLLLDSIANHQDRYHAWAKQLNAEVHRPEIGKPIVVGGADVTFDCVASAQSIDDGIRFTRSGGTFVLVGMPGILSRVDWTPLWYKELTMHAAYAYGPERTANGVEDTFDLAIRLMRTWGPRLQPMLGTPYRLTDYREAFRAAIAPGKSKAVKTVFAVND